MNLAVARKARLARLASRMFAAKMSTASGFSAYRPSRPLVNGISVMVNRNAKFHQASPSL
jgi:hypothetical protein